MSIALMSCSKNGKSSETSLGAATERGICYSKEEHTEILSVIAEGNECMRMIDGDQDESWYKSNWVMFGLGAILGGSAGWAVTR